MKKTDIVKLALSGWKLSDIKELVELEKTMNDIETNEDEKEDEKDDKKEDERTDKKEDEKTDKKEDEKEDKKEDERTDKKEDEKTKTMNDMMELIKKLQDGKTREKIEDDKSEEDILKDMFRDFM
mgnify:CR=1 FL=1|jgi:hypothetical protein